MARLRAVRKPSRALILALVVAVPALVLGLVVLRAGGVFRNVASPFTGNCHTIDLAGSSEDIRIDRQRGIAYLSLLDRDDIARGGAGNGTVMLLDLNLAEPAPRAAMNFDPPNFRPHGLSLLQAEGQPPRLFAISHPADGSHVVEIAERDSNGGFVPRETIRDAAFVHPNALVATGPRQFYLVNDAPSRDEGRGLGNLLSGSGEGTVLYYDGEQSRVLVEGLAYPAGLALSPDGSHLYVGEALANSIRIYRRDLASGALTLVRAVAVGSAPDNLDVDADGVVWIAAHPKLFRFLAHLGDAAKPSPTQVLRFDPRQPGSRPETVYADDGTKISAGSVAAPWRGQFLVGALLDKKVLICKRQ